LNMTRTCCLIPDPAHKSLCPTAGIKTERLIQIFLIAIAHRLLHIACNHIFFSSSGSLFPFTRHALLLIRADPSNLAMRKKWGSRGSMHTFLFQRCLVIGHISAPGRGTYLRKFGSMARNSWNLEC
jgi:hypothetical protein